MDKAAAANRPVGAEEVVRFQFWRMSRNGKGNVSRVTFAIAWLKIPLKMIVRSFHDFEEYLIVKFESRLRI